MRRADRQTRRGFTLIEAIAAVVILAALVPTTALVMLDATRARHDALAVNRASWLAQAVMENVIADINSPSPDLGMDALGDPAAYVGAPGTGLAERLGVISSFYASRGVTWSLSIGPPVNAVGAATGDDTQDVYRLVTVNVQWTNSKGEAAAFALPALLTDVTP